jgi:hypothetical protein
LRSLTVVRVVSRPNEDSLRPPHDYAQLQRPLELFRAKRTRTKIHFAELAVLWAVAAHLVFLPWALGGTRLWAQIISLGLSAIGMLLALLPRSDAGDNPGASRRRRQGWMGLLTFPVFWIGLALLAYVTVQALNPAWVFRIDSTNWWMEAIPHRSSLPSGVDVPFERGGPWRMLIVYGSAWLTVCTIWVAFTRRRTIQLLCMTLAANGLLLAAVGILQRLLGNGKILWLVDSPSPSFFSTFIYKNHGGAYLVLALAVTCGLAGWYYLRGLRRLEKSNPSGVLAFFATCIAVSVLTSYARGATIVMLVFLVVCIGAFVVHQLRLPSESRRPVVAIVLVLVFGYFLKTGFEALRSREAWDRLKQGITQQDSSLASRELATTASLEMLRDLGVKGSGAGSFRFLFPTYQARHPALLSVDGRRMYWEHAHNDLVEFPIELGLPGVAAIVLSGIYWMLLLVRSRFWTGPMSVCGILGALLLAAYAWWDFPLQCPAILVTWCALWPVVTLWTKFEDARAPG